MVDTAIRVLTDAKAKLELALRDPDFDAKQLREGVAELAEAIDILSEHELGRPGRKPRRAVHSDARSS